MSRPGEMDEETQLITAHQGKRSGRNRVAPLDDYSDNDRRSAPKKRSSWLTKQTTFQKREAAVARVKEELKGRYTGWLIDPRKPWVRVWDVISALALLFTAVITPFELAFLSSSIGDALFWVNRAVDVVFCLDILFQFFMMYYDEVDDIWVQSNARIAIAYLKSWFILDALSVVPFDLIVGGMMANDGMSGNLGMLKAVRIIKLFRVFKLLRVLRIGRIFVRLEEALNINYKTLQLFTFAGMVMFCAHWMACALQLCVMVTPCTVSEYVDGVCSNWVYYYNANGGCGKLLKMDESDNLLVNIPQSARPEYVAKDPFNFPPVMNLFTVYWSAVYWAVMTMSTIGYGDVTPQNDGERVYVVIGMCFGAAIYAYLVGNVCSIISSMAAGQEAFRQEMDDLNSFLVDNSVPATLSAKLRDFYRYRNSNVSVNNSMVILNTLSPQLRREVCDFTDIGWLSTSDLFQGFPKEIIINLCLAIIPEVYVPGEMIFLEGTVCDRLFITERGVVYSRGKYYGRPGQVSLPTDDDDTPNSTTFRLGFKRKNSSKKKVLTKSRSTIGGSFSGIRPSWIGLLDMSSSSGVHRHFAVSLTHSVLFTIRRDELERELAKHPKHELHFRRKMARKVMKELILQYAKALGFIMKQTEDSLINVLCKNENSLQKLDNWILKHKLGEVMDLAALKLGPQSGLSRLIRSARHAAVIIQAAYRGMKARRRFLAEMQYRIFMLSQRRGVENSLGNSTRGMATAAHRLTDLSARVSGSFRRDTKSNMDHHEPNLGSTLQTKKEFVEGVEEVGQPRMSSQDLPEVKPPSRISEQKAIDEENLSSAQPSPLDVHRSTYTGPSSPSMSVVLPGQQMIVSQVSKIFRKQLAEVTDELKSEIQDMKRTIRDIATHRSNKTYG